MTRGSIRLVAFWLWYKGVSAVPANIAGLFTGVMPVSAAITASDIKVYFCDYVVATAVSMAAQIAKSIDKRR